MENTIKPFDLKNIFYTLVLSVVLIGSLQAVAYAFATDGEKACTEKASNAGFIMRTGVVATCLDNAAKEKSQKYELNRN